MKICFQLFFNVFKCFYKKSCLKHDQIAVSLAQILVVKNLAEEKFSLSQSFFAVFLLADLVSAVMRHGIILFL